MTNPSFAKLAAPVLVLIGVIVAGSVIAGLVLSAQRAEPGSHGQSTGERSPRATEPPPLAKPEKVDPPKRSPAERRPPRDPGSRAEPRRPHSPDRKPAGQTTGAEPSPPVPPALTRPARLTRVIHGAAWNLFLFDELNNGNRWRHGIAPAGSRYLRVSFSTGWSGSTPKELPLTAPPPRRPWVTLYVGSTALPPLGRLAETPDPVDPLKIGPLTLAPDTPAEFTLVFPVPEDAAELALSFEDGDVERLTVDSPPPLQSDRLSGLWHRNPGVLHPLHHDDPVLDALLAPECKLLEITRSPMGLRLESACAGIASQAFHVGDDARSVPVRLEARGGTDSASIFLRTNVDGELVIQEDAAKGEPATALLFQKN